MKQTKTIKVGISVGDLAGVGPEIVLKTFQDKRMFDHLIPILYCSEKALKFHQKKLQIDNVPMLSVKDVSAAKPNKLNLVEPWKDELHIDIGVSSTNLGKHAFASLEMAVKDLAKNSTDVLVTAPINKDNIQAEGFNFPGHTEYLANYSNSDSVLMLLVQDSLRVAVATGHIPLKDVAKELSVDLLTQKIDLMNATLEKDFGIVRPKIAVMGLNPHAGENGLLGDEEQKIITPAIKKAKESGVLCFGPYASDGLFGSSNFRNFDGILAMYHDQGLTPFKALAFDSGVNFTAGLPIVRTSPDHGTAYDIAGKNIASPQSFRQSIFLACDVFRMRKKQKEISANPLPFSS